MNITTPNTTSERTTAHERTPMSPMRKAALIAGVAYIATFVFSIPVKFGFWASSGRRSCWPPLSPPCSASGTRSPVRRFSSLSPSSSGSSPSAST